MCPSSSYAVLPRLGVVFTHLCFTRLYPEPNGLDFQFFKNPAGIVCFTAITLSQFMEKDYYSLYISFHGNFLGISNPKIATSMVFFKSPRKLKL